VLTQAIQVMKYIRASAGRAGISVVFEDINQPRHDGKTIYLPMITYKTTERELQQLMASIDHEVAHDRFSSFEVLKEIKLDPKGLLMFTWNFLEDSRVNVIEAQEYKGFKDNWDDCSSELVKTILKKSIKETTLIAKMVSALICWESKVSASNFPLIELASSKHTPDKKITDVLNSYSRDLVRCHSILDKEEGTRATHKLALDILKSIGHDCKEEVEEALSKAKAAAKGKGKGKGDEKAVAPASGDLAEGGDKDASDAEDDEYKVIKVVLTADDLSKFSLTMPEEGGEMGKVGINFDPVKSDGHWDMTDYDKFLVADYPRSLGQDKYFKPMGATRFLAGYNHDVKPLLVTQENFAQQVRRLIQIRARVQTQYGTRKGKLDQSRLSRICFDAPGFNEKVFKTRIENKTLDAAITVLVDMSGSMMGQKAYYALASTLLLNEVCSTLGIPLEVIGFSDDYGAAYTAVPLMFVYKSFNDLKITNDQMERDFAKSSCFMNGNPDGENILWAHNRLIKRKEKKRLLVVMSDGSPAASKSSVGLEEFTHQVIDEIEKSKQVDIYGLGLCSDSVTHYYKRNDVVYKPQEIPSKLLTLIEKRILT
jgi:cobalamin biosynthesis protein CobT